MSALRMAAAVAVLLCLPAGCGHPVEPQEAAAHAMVRAEIERLRTRLPPDGTDAALLRQLGTAHWKLGELDAAEDALRRSIAQEPIPEAMWQLIDLLFGRGRYQAAYAAYVEMERLHPKTTVPDWLLRIKTELAVGRRAGDAVRQRSGPDSPLVNSIGMRFVDVGPATFMRGSNSGDSNQRPARLISVTGFQIGQFEVSVDEFQAFLKDTGRSAPVGAAGVISDGRGTLPVTGVSWLEARAFAIWLSAREGAIYRLPTEAEWELTARGPSGLLNPWGNERGQSQVDGNWGLTSGAHFQAFVAPVTPVGSLSRDRSPLGAFDMAGNIREWCLDEFDPTYYRWSPSTNPFGPTVMVGLKSLRGGAWNEPRNTAFGVMRSGAAANQGYTGYGFRIARETSASLHKD